LKDDISKRVPPKPSSGLVFKDSRPFDGAIRQAHGPEQRRGTQGRERVERVPGVEGSSNSLLIADTQTLESWNPRILDPLDVKNIFAYEKRSLPGMG